MPRPNVREQLIDACLQTLQLKGFNGCAVKDITQAAGVPKGSFYNHFESKEAMALQALERFWDRGAARRALLTDANFDPVDRLRRHFKALSDAVISNDFQLGCFIGNFSSEMAQNGKIRQRLVLIYDAWGRAIQNCICDALEQGRVRLNLPAETIASFLLNAWEGAVLRSKVEQDQAPLDQFTQVVFEGFFID